MLNTIAKILQSYSPYILLFLTAIVTWIWWSLKNKFATKDSVEKVEKRVDLIETKIEKRLDRINSRMDGMATKENISEIQLNIEKISGKQNTQEAILKKIDSTLAMQQDFLLNGRGKK